MYGTSQGVYVVFLELIIASVNSGKSIADSNKAVLSSFHCIWLQDDLRFTWIYYMGESLSYQTRPHNT